MAAPTPTARLTPTGFKMPDGFRTLIASAKYPAIQFWETSVKPPAADGGDLIPTTTMHNVLHRTFYPKRLITTPNITINAMYYADVMVSVYAIINDNHVWTVTHPDGSTHCFWGALIKFEPGENKEGEPPTAQITIGVTNWDSVNNVEAGPVYTGATGT